MVVFFVLCLLVLRCACCCVTCFDGFPCKVRLRCLVLLDVWVFGVGVLGGLHVWYCL